MEGHITIEELEKWLKWRTFPATRSNADELLASPGMQAYNRWGIVRKTNDFMADDENLGKYQLDNKGKSVVTKYHEKTCLPNVIKSSNLKKYVRSI